MKGAIKYAQLFKTGQYGKLYLVSGKHARGSTFHIQVLPDGEDALPNGKGNLCLNDNAVEAYGIIGGQPGWTESYGWIYHGPWVRDFNSLVEEAEKTKQSEKEQGSKRAEQKADDEEQRIQALLDAY